MSSAPVSVDAQRVAELQRAAELAAEERERYAMRAADLESYVAQRTFLEDQMLPQRGAPITYERMYTMRHNALVESHESMATVYRLLRRGRVSRAMQVANDVLGGVSDEDSEEESLETDEPVLPAAVNDFLPEDVQQALLAQLTEPAAASAAAPAAPAAPVHAFSGRSFRLDD